MIDIRYTYAVARIRALETNLLDRPTIERMMNEDAAGVIRVLKETEYASTFSEIDNPLDFEYGLVNELDRVLILVENLSPEPEIIHLFRISYDFNNLKVLLQAEYSDKTPDESISPLGLARVDEIEKMINGETTNLPDYLKQTYQQAMTIYRKHERIEEFEVLINRTYWNFLITEIEKTKINFLIQLFKKQIDLLNIRTFIRLKESGIELSDKLISQGTLDTKFFLENLNEDWDLFLKQLTSKGYSEIVIRGLDEWPQDKSMWKLELASDNHLIKYIEGAKLQYFGIEPLVAYFIKKKVETNVLRIIFVSKINQLPLEKIRQRLRIQYV